MHASITLGHGEHARSLEFDLTETMKDERAQQDYEFVNLELLAETGCDVEAGTLDKAVQT